jgi:hypothetical membrane protein
MHQSHSTAQHRLEPILVKLLGWYAIAGCVIFAAAILIADVVVPNHDWIADTISDLGAGQYEFIVDIGIYAFSASLVATSLLTAHLHMGGWKWSLAIISLAVLALIVFLVGARNEYGDSDTEGVVIHIYLVGVLGVLMGLVPLLMRDGADRIVAGSGRLFIGIAILWIISAPVFFFMPDGYDGIYERYLGLIAFGLVFTIARMFLKYPHVTK